MPSQFPPGPIDLFGIRTLSRMKSDVLGSFAELQRRHGDCVSFWTGPYRFFVFYHPDQVREVLVTQAKSFIRFPRVMKTFAQWNGKSVLIAEGPPWIRQRRLVQPAFQPRRMEHYGQTMTAMAQRLIASWRTELDRLGHLDVDISQAMGGLTLSIICKTMFDSDMTDESSDMAEAVAILSQVAFDEMQAPVRWPMWLPTRYNRRKRWALEVLDRVVWQFVRDRRREGRDHGDLLSMLLSAVDHESDGSRLDDRGVRDEVVTLMLAGHDTTAAGFDWLWYCLARYPHVARRCQEEIDRVVGSRAPATSDIERLPYLTATVKETLRLYPPAIGIFLRQATKDVRLGETEVPKKSLVTLSSYVTQRDPRWFADPEAFDPERFLPSRVDEIPSGAYFPFGAGPRICIGQSFAMTELTLVATTLLQSLDVVRIPDTPEPELHVLMALRPKDPLMLRWKFRS